MVLKAVKYGACDILITPSSPDDIREKIEVNLIRKAA
jgi:ActR/RegA family two-component response regulator